VNRDQLAAFQNATIDDLLWPGIRLLIVGVNPGLWTAAVNAPFARPGNRFWPALHRAGILNRQVDASEGMSENDLAHVRERGLGITNLVARATARADELGADELLQAPAHIERVVDEYSPKVVAILGITSYSTPTKRSTASLRSTRSRPTRPAST
jgi:TDG/mug DNA glycosylase family protein